LPRDRPSRCGTGTIQPKVNLMARIMMQRSFLCFLTLRTGGGTLALLMAAGSALAQSDGGSRESHKSKPFVVAEQGIGLVPDGQTIHAYRAYVQYQIPPDARKLPAVLWHGGGAI
jgi:hypothetical protein